MADGSNQQAGRSGRGVVSTMGGFIVEKAVRHERGRVWQQWVSAGGKQEQSRCCGKIVSSPGGNGCGSLAAVQWAK